MDDQEETVEWRMKVGRKRAELFYSSDGYEGHRHTNREDNMILPLFLQCSIFLIQGWRTKKKSISMFSDRPIKIPLN